MDRRIREELRRVIDEAKRERLDSFKREQKSMQLAQENRARATRAREKAERLENRRIDEEWHALAAIPPIQPEELIEALVAEPQPAVYVPCAHRGLRAPRLATGADSGNFPEDFRCPDCRMLLDGPL